MMRTAIQRFLIESLKPADPLERGSAVIQILERELRRELKLSRIQHGPGSTETVTGKRRGANAGRTTPNPTRLTGLGCLIAVIVRYMVVTETICHINCVHFVYILVIHIVDRYYT